ncbi:MAG: DNA polymerase Y family protein, partial [bacterium]
VERSQDASLRGQPLIVGGQPDGTGIVAAVSAEARAAGVRAGQTVAAARRLCPTGVFCPGDFDAYARISEEVTSILLAASRRVERPSADEAYVDLTRESGGDASPVPAAEAIKDEIQRRLGLDASLGLASSRMAARVASSWARPRGLLVVLPGYEASFLARQPVSFLPDLPPHIETALVKAGLNTLGDLLAADADALAEVTGPSVAEKLQRTARGEGEEPIAVAAPPIYIQEEALIRDRRTDRASLIEVVDSLAARAVRRLRPFGLEAGQITVEVQRGEVPARRTENVEPGLTDEATACAVATTLADALVDPASSVRRVQVRLTRLQPAGLQATLFPELSGLAHRRFSL